MEIQLFNHFIHTQITLPCWIFFEFNSFSYTHCTQNVYTKLQHFQNIFEIMNEVDSIKKSMVYRLFEFQTRINASCIMQHKTIMSISMDFDRQFSIGFSRIFLTMDFLVTLPSNSNSYSHKFISTTECIVYKLHSIRSTLQLDWIRKIILLFLPLLHQISFSFNRFSRACVWNAGCTVSLVRLLLLIFYFAWIFFVLFNVFYSFLCLSSCATATFTIVNG